MEEDGAFLDGGTVLAKGVCGRRPARTKPSQSRGGL